MFCYIWEFRANQTRIAEFESAYGPGGRWAQLFRKAPGYLRTELLKDPVEANRYLTIDYWVDREAYERFSRNFGAEYKELDMACEAFTESEKHIGEFEVR